MLFTQKCYAEENGTDNGNYEFTIPSEVSVTQKDNKLEGLIPVTVKTHNRKWLSVDIKSKNNFNLVGKTGKQKFPYQLSKISFDVNPQYNIDNDDATTKEEILLTSSGSTTIADDYSDQVNFVVSSVDDTRTIVLDCNGGSYNNQSKIIYTVKNGSSYGQLPYLSSTAGRYFYGWQDETGNIIYSRSIVQPTTEKLTAKWIVRSYLDFDGMLDSVEQNGQNWIMFNVYIDDKLIIENNNLFNPTMTEYVGEKITIKVNNVEKGFDFLGTSYIDNGLKQYQDENGNYYFEGILQEGRTRVVCKIQTQSTFSIKDLVENNNCNSVIFDEKLPENYSLISDISSEFGSNAYAYVAGTELHIGNPEGKVIAPEISDQMFLNCTTLKRIDLSGLDTSKVTSMKSMFKSCSNLIDVNVEKIDVQKVKSFYSMFRGDKKLPYINLAGWNSKSVSNIDYMFNNCLNIEKIEGLNELDISKCSTLIHVFENCTNLKSVEVNKWDISNITKIYFLFTHCTSLKEINIKGWNTHNLKCFATSFNECKSLEAIPGIENLDLSNCYDLSYLFCYSTSLKSLDMSKWNVSSLTDTEYMFAFTNFETIDLSSWNCTLKYTYYMFYSCSKLKTIYISDGLKIINKQSQRMFEACKNLVGGSGTTYDPTFVDATAARIDGGPNSPGYFTDIADKTLDETSETENDVDAIIETESGQDNDIQEFKSEEIYNPELEEQQEE